MKNLLVLTCAAAIGIAANAATLNLSTVTTDTTIPNGTTLTGTLNSNVKLTIASRATVTLSGVTINGVDNISYKWAGLTCTDNATIILASGTSSTVKGFHADYPGIYVKQGYTLTIQGSGLLTARSNGSGAGIGGGNLIDCGNIVIEGGKITAYGSGNSAGIGSGYDSTCGNITISGGTVTTYPGIGCAGIGSGFYGACGNITVSGGTIVAAGTTVSEGSSVGIGSGDGGICGSVVISGGDVEAYGKGYRVGIGCGTQGACGGVFVWGGSVYAQSGRSGVAPIGASESSGSCGPIIVGDDMDDTTSGSTRTIVSKVVNLANVTEATTLADGRILTGTLAAAVKVSIADGATVTLRDVTINGVNNSNYGWAGITCNGNATIILEGSNTVKGFYEDYPGIYVPEGKTLTIKGDGSLDASGSLGSNGYRWAGGIGGGYHISCGSIRIEGGTITAAGGMGAANIGGGSDANCGDITITKGVTSVTATQDSNASCSIGRGSGGTVGTVTVGGVVGEISENPNNTYTYTPTRVNLASKTGDYTAQDGDAMYGETTHTVMVPSGTSAMINGVEVAGVRGDVIDLGSVNADTIVADGMTVTGTLAANVQVSIASGATVTLRDVTINGVHDSDYRWAGLTCLGNATIILEGSNTVKGFYGDYPGIYVPQDYTLTIRGDGSLNASGNASGNGYGAGIGGRWGNPCGNIVIDGDCTITAVGGWGAAGIGSCVQSRCGNITLSGGTIYATGGENAAGIGSGYNRASCGDITITKGVTRVTATKGTGAPYSIGAGGGNGTCGTVTIGGVVGAISESPYTYTPTRVNLASKTGDYTAADGEVLYGETAHTVTVPGGASVMINGVEVAGGGGAALPAPTFSADGKAATTEFVQGAGGKWTLTTFAELGNDALGSDVANSQIKVYSASTVEGLESASPMSSGVEVKEKKSAVKTTIEVTPPSGASQFFRVKFGE